MLRRHLPSLSLPEVKGLALWSIGIVLAQAVAFTAFALAYRFLQARQGKTVFA